MYVFPDCEQGLRNFLIEHKIPTHFLEKELPEYRVNLLSQFESDINNNTEFTQYPELITIHHLSKFKTKLPNHPIRKRIYESLNELNTKTQRYLFDFYNLKYPELLSNKRLNLSCFDFLEIIDNNLREIGYEPTNYVNGSQVPNYATVTLAQRLIIKEGFYFYDLEF